MPKRYKIKWSEQDTKNLSRAVKSFNQKRNKLIKQVPELEDILPAKESVRNIKKNIYSRNDLNKKLNSLKRFMKKGAEQNIVTESGVRTTKYQMEELKIQHRIINAKRKKALDEAKVSTEKGTMGSIRKMNLKPKSNNSQNINKTNWDSYVKNVERQSMDSYYVEKDRRYRENYFKAIEKELGKTYANKLKKSTKSLSDTDFVNAYYENPDLQIEFAYSAEEQMVRKDIIQESWKEYVNQLKEKNNEMDS